MVLCRGDCKDWITSLKSGIRLTLTSATSPWAIRRLVASPLAETPSHWVPPPWRISVTISSEVSANFTLILQPVWLVNGVTQSTFGSVLPLSTYPVQATRLRVPSPAPMLCLRVDPVCAVDVPPQAARTSIVPTAAMRVARYRFIQSPPSPDRCRPPQSPGYAAGSRTGARGGRAPAGHPS